MQFESYRYFLYFATTHCFCCYCCWCYSHYYYSNWNTTKKACAVNRDKAMREALTDNVKATKNYVSFRENCEHATRKKCKLCVNFLIFIRSSRYQANYMYERRERVSEKEARGRGVSTQQPTSSFQSQTYHFTVTTCSLNPPLRIFLVCYRHTVTGTHDPGFPLPITVTKVHSSRFLIHLNSLTKRIFSSFFPPLATQKLWTIFLFRSPLRCYFK